ncbi:hypothetical protein GCM10011383_15960 [Hymenobacter cavernae]|uniref:Uncharacterized protein n=1 Tax=Hymenobacter cavernae TaxID=2044852 RepID=A0ABQ1TWR7_9BACT|nr:hypothetical protein GCM10011383_15960 [Hymenobacter cavernae]
MSNDQSNAVSKLLTIDFAKFLESIPPGKLVEVPDLGILDNRAAYLEENTKLNKCDIRIYCDHESCNGIRFFRRIEKGNEYLKTEDHSFLYISYQCSNCRYTTRTYSLALKYRRRRKY